jgi:serine/threonine-protein kinase HipA
LASEGIVVFVYLPGECEAVPAGLLTLSQRGREISSTFVYGKKYKLRPKRIELDPVELPITKIVDHALRPPAGRPFFGVLRDAAPDAWGRLVINDRFLAKNRGKPEMRGLKPASIELPEVQYLLGAKNDRVGALDFRVHHEDMEPESALSGIVRLDQLVEQADRIQVGGIADPGIATLLLPGQSLGGARPKASVFADDKLWIAKFPIEADRVNVPRLECATLDLANACGISVPEHRLEELGDGRVVLLVERFDRKKSRRGWLRTHYASAMTLLHRNEHNQGEASYQDIANVLRQQGVRAVESSDRRELFRRMVFNVAVNNDDDHLRNHGFLRNESGGWKLSPAFDVVPRPRHVGSNLERRQAIGVGAQERKSTVANLLSAPAAFGLSPDDAREEVLSIARVVGDWRLFLGAKGLSVADLAAVGGAFEVADDLAKRARNSSKTAALSVPSP